MVRSWARQLLAVGTATAGTLATALPAIAAGPEDVPGASAAASDSSLIRDASGMTAGSILSGITGGSTFGSANVANLQSGARGSAAGNGGQPFAIWTGGGYLHTNFDNPALPYSGDVYSGLIGADYTFSNGIAVGLAGGYENWNVDTTFDSGTLKTSGYTAAPYVLIALGRYLTLSGVGGYSSLSSDETRSEGNIRGSFDSKRWFGATMLNGNYRGDNWLFNASLGYIYTDQKDDAYAETGTAGAGAVGENTTKIGQGRLGIKIGYDIGGIVPYATARLDHEFTQAANVVVGGTTVANSDTGYVLGGGVGFTRGGISANIEGDTVEGRSNLTVYQLLGKVRFQF
jgi:hypothetical protein